MKSIRLLVFIALSMQLSIAAAADSLPDITAVDTSNWKCKYCEVEEGWSGEIELGLGNVSEDSYKFGEYNGLNEKGGFVIGNANVYYRDEDASYLDLSVLDLGLDTRSLSVEGGRQGSYKLFLRYDEIARFISNTGKTPYTGSTLLTLPPAWVPAGTTGTMTGLAASLQQVDIDMQRKRMAAGLSFSPDSPWRYAVKVRHETKEGSKRVAGAFYFNAAQLIQPVDYVTDEMDASVSYNTNKWQANLAYYLSTFSNNNKSLTWENAFTPGAAGADSGQLALPPDNQFHQFVLSAGYELGERSHLSGDIAIGRMEQNDSLLAATQNATTFPGSLSTPSANSANAEVATLDAKFNIVSLPTDKLRLNLAYIYNDRDNTTPQLNYDWVKTDTYTAVPRTNLPYSFTQNVFKLSADYQLARRTKLGAGYEMNRHERTYQEIDETEENTLWGRVRMRSADSLVVELKLAQIERDTSTYNAVPEIDPPQNVLLRKYNLADRVRDTIGLHVNINPLPQFSIGLNLDIAEDDYDQSPLGLTDGREVNLNGDISVMLSEETSAHLFIGQEHIKSTQAGSQSFSSADWLASNDDTVDTLGLGATHVLIEDTLDIGADYVKSTSTGKVTVSSGSPDPLFPDLKTDMDSVKLFANYRLKEMITLRASFWHERYDSSDWSTDGVSPATISNVLSLGELSPSYNVNVVKLSVLYKF